MNILDSLIKPLVISTVLDTVKNRISELKRCVEVYNTEIRKLEYENMNSPYNNMRVPLLTGKVSQISQEIKFLEGLVVLCSQ